MTRILVAVTTVAVVAAALVAPAFGQEQPTPNPWPAKGAKIFFYVDTVTSGPGESPFGVDADKFCAQRNFFQRGMHVVFRMSAVDAKTGKVLTSETTKYAYIKVPGEKNIAMTFGKHGKTDDSPWFWTGAWNVPLDYPLGTVDFQIVVKTKTKKVGIFRQIPVAPAKLTIIE